MWLKRNLWRFVMAAKPKFKSRALESIHASAQALAGVGAMDKVTLREFDAACQKS